MTKLFVRMVRESVCVNDECGGNDFTGVDGKPLTIKPDGTVADEVVVCTECGTVCDIGALDDGEFIDVEYYDQAPPAGPAPMDTGSPRAQRETTKYE